MHIRLAKHFHLPLIVHLRGGSKVTDKAVEVLDNALVSYLHFVL